MAKVTFKVITPDKLKEQDYTLGQLLFVHDVSSGMGKIYLDYGGKRVCYTPEVQSGINYLGIMDDGFVATDKETWKIDNVLITPKEKDVVVYGKKEYMWRKDKDDNEFKWMEIGDEESPDWLDSTGNEWNT